MKLHMIAAAGAAGVLVGAAGIAGGAASAAGVTPAVDYSVVNCLYHNGVKLGCMYVDRANKRFLLCDSRSDGLYVKGRFKYGGHISPDVSINVSGAAPQCIQNTAAYPASGTHVGIVVGVQGIGWTAYKYGYA